MDNKINDLKIMMNKLISFSQFNTIHFDDRVDDSYG